MSDVACSKVTPSRSRARPCDDPRPLALRSRSTRPSVRDHEVRTLSNHGEPGRHDADDASWAAVSGDCRAQNVGSASESRLPELVAKQDDAIVALQIFVSRVQPPHRRLNSERGKRVRGNGEASHFFGLTIQNHVDTRRTDHAQVVERLVAFTPGDEIGRADNVARPIAPQVVLPDHDNLVGILVWQRFEHDTADHAEDGGRRANPERKREHGGNGEPRRARERACRESQVLEQGGSHISLG